MPVMLDEKHVLWIIIDTWMIFCGTDIIAFWATRTRAARANLTSDNNLDRFKNNLIRN